MARLVIPSDDELKSTPYYFGRKEVHFLPKQWEFVFAPETEICYLGGYGCQGAEATINGIPIAEVRASLVQTLFGTSIASRSYLKGQADLFRVRTQSGKTVTATLDHRFLSPEGWNRLRDLHVGALIAVDGISDGPNANRKSSDSTGRYSGSPRLYGGFPLPATVASREQAAQQRRRDCGSGYRDSSLSHPSMMDSVSRFESRDFALQFHGPGEHTEAVPGPWNSARRVHEGASLLDTDAPPLPYRCDPSSESRSPAQSESRFGSGLGLLATAPYQAGDQRQPAFRAGGTGRRSLHLDASCSDYNSAGTWDEIIDIQFVRHGDFYDLTVPFFEHYLGDGVWHHNSGKTQTGIMRATRLATWYPGNRGIIGRYASTDLAATTQRDCLEFWTEAGLLEDFKERGKYKTPTAFLRCVDPITQRILPNKLSEVQFLHLDDPTHVHGHRVGFFWPDEISEISREAWNKLHSRMRLEGFAHIYSAFGTGNPEGHNWPYMHFFDPEEMAKLKPEDRKKRRGIHATSYENWFLEPEYLENMLSVYSPAFRKKYIEGSFDVFEGQIYEEFEPSLHVFSLYNCFRKGLPTHWTRVLGVDVGGSDPWAWIFVAVDDMGNLIVYDEIYAPGTRVGPFVAQAKPKIANLKFKAMVIDYANKLAAGELAEQGIRMTNAQKTNKMESVLRLSGYLHANEKRAFPDWHPKRGHPGSPGIFFASTCKNLIGEIPQQRWRKIRGQEGLANEIDPSVANHAVDATLYCLRELPRPSTLERGIIDDIRPEMSVMGKIMNFHRRNAEEQKKRDLWNIRMGNGHRGLRMPQMPDVAPIFDMASNTFRGTA